MKIVSLQAENFKILKAVEINPQGNVVTIGGDNGEGKSSVLDAIWVALVGKSVAPPVPIRKGQEECRLRLDLGELIVTRSFRDKEGKLTDTLKVEDAEGRRYPTPQTLLDNLLGHIGFDPFAFVQMKPDKQAETLLEMVALPIDLDELAEADETDYAKRRTLNTTAKELRAQIDAIRVPLNPPEPVDRDALLKQLADAADHNSAIQSEAIRQRDLRSQKAQYLEAIETYRKNIESARASATRKIENIKDEAKKEITGLETAIGNLEKSIAERDSEIAAAQPLDAPVDIPTLREKIAEADETAKVIAAIEQRAELTKRAARAEADSAILTGAMEAREKERRAALANAVMPIEGLGFAIDGKKATVTMDGLPFEQANSAAQIRASVAIAMAANPQLRVLRIKDGSLLGDKQMAILAEMAAEQDFQLWIERVGTGGVGIVMQDGAIVGQDKPEPAPAKPKAAAKAPAKETLL